MIAENSIESAGACVVSSYGELFMSLTQTYTYYTSKHVISHNALWIRPCIVSRVCFSEDRYLLSSKKNLKRAALLILYAGAHKISKSSTTML